MTTRSTVNLLQIEAEAQAARHRTGRERIAIYADWAATEVYMVDLYASSKALWEAGKVDAERTTAAINGIAVASKPQTLRVAGVAVRRIDPEGDLKRLSEGFTARHQSRREHRESNDRKMALLETLRAELIAEINRAGVSTDEAKTAFRAMKFTRAKAEQ